MVRGPLAGMLRLARPSGEPGPAGVSVYLTVTSIRGGEAPAEPERGGET